MGTSGEPDTVAALRQSALFSALDEPALRGIVARCRTIRRPAGTMLVTPRQQADRFFVVLSGRVKVFQLSPRGDEQILHLCDPGDAFGEAAMWAGGNFPAYAEVVSDAALAVLPRDVLRRAVADNADLAMAMMAGLSAKLRQFAGLIEQLSLKEVPARLAAVLWRESDGGRRTTIQLTQTKRQLAAQIGTVAETLSRALAKMKAEGLIDVAGKQITLLDVPSLRDLAQGG